MTGPSDLAFPVSVRWRSDVSVEISADPHPGPPACEASGNPSRWWALAVDEALPAADHPPKFAAFAPYCVPGPDGETWYLFASRDDALRALGHAREPVGGQNAPENASAQ